jgi:NAD-dependent dihydropyrimidine dehydrogenase PreA subunit
MAVDLVACTVIGFDDPFPPTVRRAAERGIGPAALSEVRCLGVNPAEIRIGDWKRPEAPFYRHIPLPFLSIARRVFAARPKVDRSLCTGCGTCVRTCPSGAMRTGQAGVPIITVRDCIRCYCCQELCPAGAVRITQPLLRRLVGSGTVRSKV